MGYLQKLIGCIFSPPSSFRIWRRDCAVETFLALSFAAILLVLWRRSRQRPQRITGPSNAAPSTSSDRHVVSRASSNQIDALKKIQGSVVTCSTVSTFLTPEFDIIPSAIPLLTRLAKTTDLYLITQVETDEQEEKARKALIECGAGVNPIKILFCGSVVGMTAMCRQLEPALHVDANVEVITALYRFMPRLLFVGDSSSVESLKANNVGTTKDLPAYFNVIA